MVAKVTLSQKLNLSGSLFPLLKIVDATVYLVVLFLTVGSSVCERPTGR